MNERVTTALLPRRRTPHTAQLPTEYQHPSFPDGLPILVPMSQSSGQACGDCEVIDHAIAIGLHVEYYVALQWRHRRAFHGGAR